MIALIGAMDEEIEEFVRHTTVKERVDWYGLPFVRGSCLGRDVVIAKTGIGKSLSAMTTQRLLDLFPVTSVFFSGIAGALREDIEIGDVVVARDCVQHDFDVSAMGYKRGEIPYTGFRFIPCDEGLFQCALSYIPGEGEGRVLPGRIVTGDQFMAAKNIAGHRYLQEELSGDAVEMEGASVGLVCAYNRVPFLLIRVISDKADGNSPENFKDFLSKASKESWRIVEHTLSSCTA